MKRGCCVAGDCRCYRISIARRSCQVEIGTRENLNEQRHQHDAPSAAPTLHHRGGLSVQWHRPSFFATKYMQQHGFKIVPVNPRYAASNGQIVGETCYASLTDIACPLTFGLSLMVTATE